MTDLFDQLEGTPGDEEPGSRRERSSHRGRSRSRRGGRRGSVASLVVSIGLLVGLAALGFFVIRPLFSSSDNGTGQVQDYPGPGVADVQVTIPGGATGSDIGLILRDVGVVATTDAFSAAYSANSNATSIQPGTYDLLTQMRASDAVIALLDPANRAGSAITFPETFRSDQIYGRIAEKLGVGVDVVYAAAHDYAALGLEGPPNTHPEVVDPMEGWFYPATYTIAPGATAGDVLKEMYDRTITELDKLGVAPENRLHVLTVGSIAMREVNFPDEYPMVVRVIENRLVPGNPTLATTLGMDSTLTYWWDVQNPGVGIDPALHNTTEGGSYNTRQVPGLPPSPISAVDARAMAAAVSPAEGDWVYFVSTDMCPPGVTEFTNNTDEFNVLKAKYQDWLARYNANGKVCPVPEG